MLDAIFTRRFLAVLLAISIVSNLILLWRLTPDARRQLTLSFQRAPAVRGDDHLRGTGTGPTLIEYGDFECPFCAGMHEAMRELTDRAGVRWVYRHYPLTDIHPHAFRAAEASECAAEQGAFWPFADSLSVRYDRIGETDFVVLAGQLGLDELRFADCIRTARYRSKVLLHTEEGRTMRLRATPTYFIDRRRYEGFASADELRRQLGLSR